MIEQISIFAENKKGAMQDITSVIADAGINIESLVTNDSAEFGIIRMLVDDADKAAQCLKDAGYLVHVDNVICVEMTDSPGGLNSLLCDIKTGNINLDYIYISYNRQSSVPLAIIKAQDASEVEMCIKGYGHKVR